MILFRHSERNFQVFSESSNLANHVVKWHYLKYNSVKRDSLRKRYSVDEAKERGAKRNEFELRVKELELLLSTDWQEIANEYYDCKQELESI